MLFPWGEKLAGLLVSLHTSLFPFGLLPHLIELKLKLSLPLIVLESRPCVSPDHIYPTGVDPHRCKKRTNQDTKYEVRHCGVIKLLSFETC
jgi:hypothetical protein